MIQLIREILCFILGRRKLYLQMLKVFGSFHKIPRRNGKRILFFPMGYFEAASTWEVVLMNALALRGHECKSFVCESLVRACEVKFVDTDSSALCKRCEIRSKALFSFSNTDYFRSSRFTVKSDEEKAKRLLPRNNIELRGFSYEGIKFAEIVRPSLFHYLRIGSDQDSDEYYDVYRRFVVSAIVLFWIQERIIKDYNPDVVFVINGLFYPGALLVELAKRNGIRHITYECGYISGCLVFSDTTPSVWFPTENIWEKYREMPLSDEENEALDSYLNERVYGKRTSIQLWDKPDFDKEKAISRYNIKQYKKVFSLFTNILWDSAAIGCDEAFGGLADWVRSTITYFASQAKDCLLIVRVHPAEIKIPGQESREKILDSINGDIKDLPPNVVILGPEDNTSSYLIMELSDCVLVNTSITGVEAACYGKPVVVVGKTHYKSKGFTFDVKTREEYFGIVLGIMSGRLSYDDKNIRKIARRYAYTFFFRYMIDFPFTNQTITKFNSTLLSISSIKNLMPDQNANLDSICSFIIGEGNLVGH